MSPQILVSMGSTTVLLRSREGTTFRGPGALCIESAMTGGEGPRRVFEQLHAAADDCAVVFVDTSRPGSRRWCSMERCESRHMVRTHRARSRGAEDRST